ncbi:TPA: thioredoxin family protein [Candidatus Micrarchaeota archaeon]|nr:hypothetical protein [uncultured archaeon]HIH30977.1 thioredoxin family protein [Candidatus Micrarchaeota archaeon]
MFETSEKKELMGKIAKEKSLVLFYASWCPDCARFMPTFNSLASKTKVTLLKAVIDEDENPIWDDFKIGRVPTVVLFENGKEKGRVEEKGGSIDAAKLKRLL